MRTESNSSKAPWFVSLPVILLFRHMKLTSSVFYCIYEAVNADFSLGLSTQGLAHLPCLPFKTIFGDFLAPLGADSMWRLTRIRVMLQPYHGIFRPSTTSNINSLAA